MVIATSPMLAYSLGVSAYLQFVLCL
jgi:hypothetical protein